MQLLVLILKKLELMEPLLKQLAEAGVKGGTILEGTGMAKELMSMEDLPIIGMLRMLLAEDMKANSKVMLFVLNEEGALVARNTIKKVIGDLNVPNTGIMFSVPITYVEGLGEEYLH
jgi:hypothetical protein